MKVIRGIKSKAGVLSEVWLIDKLFGREITIRQFLTIADKVSIAAERSFQPEFGLANVKDKCEGKPLKKWKESKRKWSIKIIKLIERAKDEWVSD